MTTPSVGVVVVNHETPDDTLACLESLFGSRYPELRVVVVDNGSNDGSWERLSQIPPKAEIYRTGANMGIGDGYQVGIARLQDARVSFIILLHPDTTIGKEYFERLVGSALRHPEASGVFGTTIDTRTGEAGKLYRMHPIKGIAIEAEAVIPAGEPLSRGVGPFFCLMRNDVFSRVGLDGEYFVGGEEMDWLMRAGKAGLRFIYCPEAVLYHKVSRTTRKLRSPTLGAYLSSRNYAMFCLRNVDKTYRVSNAPYIAASILRAFMKSCRESIRYRTNLVKWSILGATDGIIQGLGLIKGYRGRARQAWAAWSG